MGSSGGFFPKQSLRRGHRWEHVTEVTEGVRAARFPRASQEAKGITPRIIHPSRGWGHWHFSFPSEASMPQFSWATSAYTSSHQRRPHDKGGKDAERMPGTEHELPVLAGTSCPHLHTDPPLHLLRRSFATCGSWVLGHKVPELPATRSEGGMSAFFSWSSFPCINFLSSSFIEIELTYDTTHM